MVAMMTAAQPDTGLHIVVVLPSWLGVEGVTVCSTGADQSDDCFADGEAASDLGLWGTGQEQGPNSLGLGVSEPASPGMGGFG